MTRPNCKYCQVVHGNTKVEIVYQDDKLIAYLNQEPASLGHIMLVPKEHHTIFEQVPDAETSKMFTVASKLSAALFDSLNLGGTNMIIANGVAAGQDIPHVAMHIIPRMQQGDNLNFEWKPKQLSEEESSIAEIKLREACANIGGFESTENKVIEHKKEAADKIIDDEDIENYLLKSLNRIP
ncbi:TPA: HIT family protein [Candidatus Woesearchaeota archaeon]|nr:HIT family protein [Candidatus Woesearchaeota archaeon]